MFLETYKNLYMLLKNYVRVYLLAYIGLSYRAKIYEGIFKTFALFVIL